MRTTAAALLGTLAALGLAAVALVAAWPTVRAQLVADLKAEAKAQDVAGGAAADLFAALAGAFK